VIKNNRDRINHGTSTRELEDSSVANGDESVGTPCRPPWVVVMVASGGTVRVDVGGGPGTSTGVVGRIGGEGSGSDDGNDLSELLLLDKEDDVVLTVVAVVFADVGTGKGRVFVGAVVFGSFATRLLAVFFAWSISFFGMALLSASHSALTGFRKTLSTFRSSSVQW
jgi:hypothetical protein